jgi:NADPH:quinone reductase-like Zn-dependent oxidoreductase
MFGAGGGGLSAVEQIGSDIAPFAAGDAVFGVTTGMGAYAEYVAIKAATIAK